MERYSGVVTTTGNSEAIRLEKSLFRAHPEFGRGTAVTASVIAPGRILVSAAVESSDFEEDPVLDAFLAFLAHDMRQHPERLEPLSSGRIAKADALTRDIDVADDEVFPADVGM